VVSSNPRYTFSVVDPATTPGSIQIAVTGIPVNLTWKGGATANPNSWDSATTSNWLNGANSDVFYAGDNVTFDDTAPINSVVVNTAQVPGDVTINNNSVNYTLTGSGYLKGGSLTKQGSGSFTLATTGTNTFFSGITNNGGTLRINPLTNTTFASVITDDGNGLGTFEKAGTNLMYLTGANSNYNGAILVSGGTLKPSNANALGTVNGSTTIGSGATLDVNGQNLGREPVTASGSGVSNAGAIFNSGGGQNNALFNVTLADDTTFGGTGRWDIRGAASDAASLKTSGYAYNVTKVGSNQVSLVNVAVDDALGNIDVQQGILDLEGSTMSPSGGLGDPSKTITVRSGALLYFYDLANALNKNIYLLDGSTITNSHGDNRISGAISLNGSNVINVGTASLSLNGLSSMTGYALNGSGNLFKNGGSTLNLYGENKWTGGLQINAGTLAIDNSLAFTANKNIMVTSTTGGSGQSGTRITVGITAGGSWTVPPGVSVNLPSAGGPTAIRSGLYANKGYSEWQGPISFYQAAGATNPGTAWVASDPSSPNSSTFVISGSMTGVLGTLSIRGDGQGIGQIYGSINFTNPVGQTLLEKTGQSSWTIYTNNNRWGDTLLHQGTLQLGVNNACPVTGLMAIGQQPHACVLDLNGFNQQVSGLASDAAYPTNQFVANSSLSANSTLTILGTNVTTFTGTVMDQAVLWEATNFISGSQVGLTLASGNTGSLTLSGTNAYTGPTTLNGGTLLVNGALSNTVVTVNNTATLGGSGSILGPVTVNAGGTLALGPNPTTLSLSNNLLLNPGAKTFLKLNKSLTPANDLLIVSGSLGTGGDLVVSNAGPALVAGDRFQLFSQPISGPFNSVALPAGYTWTNKLAFDGSIEVLVGFPTTPTNITVVVGTGTITLSWPASYTGWLLQSQTNLLGVGLANNWSTVPGSAAVNQMTMSVDLTKGTVFYRLKYPTP
jgi:autotransporter-associated beta strand protein